MTQTAGLKATPINHAPPHGPSDRSVARAVIAGGVLAVICIALFWDFLRSQILWGVREPSDWGHTLIVPAIAAWLGWQNRHRLLAESFRTNWFGLVVIVLGVTSYLLCVFGPQVLNHHNLKAVGVMTTLGGIVLLFTGWRVTLLLLFPLAYLAVFGQTISDRFMTWVTFPLQDITALGAAFIMGAFVDLDLQGNVIYIHLSDGTTRPLNVAEACSGMRMLMAFLALGVAMAYVGLRHNWQRVLLVLLGVPVAILVNILRVVTLSVLSIFNENFTTGDVHSFIGVLWLVPAFFIYLGLMWVIRNVIVEKETPPPHDPSIPDTVSGAADAILSRLDRRAPTALIAACITLVVCFAGMQAAIAWLNIYLRKEPVPLARNLAGVPKDLGGVWLATGADRVLNAAMVEQLGTNDYLNRVYVNQDWPGRPAIQLHVAYYTGMIDAVPHVPDRCFVAGGYDALTLPQNERLAIDTGDWSEDEHHRTRDGDPFLVATHRDSIYGWPIEVRMPFGEFSLRTTRFAKSDDPRIHILAGYNFLTNGHVVGHPYAIRTLAFDRSSRYAYYCKVQMTMQGSEDLDRGRFVTLTSDLYSHLLPELMQCLPDWAEYESRDDHSNGDVATASSDSEGILAD